MARRKTDKPGLIAEPGDRKPEQAPDSDAELGFGGGVNVHGRVYGEPEIESLAAALRAALDSAVPRRPGEFKGLTPEEWEEVIAEATVDVADQVPQFTLRADHQGDLLALLDVLRGYVDRGEFAKAKEITSLVREFELHGEQR